MSSWLKSVISVIDKISEWSGKSSGFFILIVIGLVVFEVVRRYGFNSPTDWNQELVVYLCIPLYIVGGGYIHSLKGHVSVDVLYIRMTPRAKAIIDLVTVPLLLVFSGVLLWFGADWARESIIRGETSGTSWEIPIFPVRLLIPLSALILLLQAFAKIVRDLKIAIGGTEHEH